MNIVLRNLPLTRIKIFGAKILLFFTSIFVNTKKKHLIKRNDINFEVDVQLKNDDVIFDIGANVGIMSLNFANKARNGKVYAFEPTHYALKKLYRNLELNPELAKNIVVTNCFVSAKSDDNPNIVAFSSWSLTNRTDSDHEHHLGTPMSADGVSSITLDDFVEKNNITN